MLTIHYFLTILLQTGIDDVNHFNNYLLFAYAMMWLVFIAYLVSLISKQRNLQQELRLMRRLLEEDEADKQG